MKIAGKCGAAVVALLSISFGVTGASDARTVPANVGQAQNPSAYGCFTNEYGVVTNSCASTQLYCVGLPTDNHHNSVWSYVSAPDPSHNIQCLAETVNSGGVVYQNSGWRQVSQYWGQMQIMDMGEVQIPLVGHGALYFCCYMAPNTKLANVMWTGHE
jgi:hypothetical protein